MRRMCFECFTSEGLPLTLSLSLRQTTSRCVPDLPRGDLSTTSTTYRSVSVFNVNRVTVTALPRAHSWAPLSETAYQRAWHQRVLGRIRAGRVARRLRLGFCVAIPVQLPAPYHWTSITCRTTAFRRHFGHPAFLCGQPRSLQDAQRSCHVSPLVAQAIAIVWCSFNFGINVSYLFAGPKSRESRSGCRLPACPEAQVPGPARTAGHRTPRRSDSPR